ncbi:MAG TPA: LacI family DNA-binding transcriptional regulator [Geminicoccaceae bacterium]|jgi:DNA-binding LacI/PurR family transcriptional regulator|nr:LacI family DNA-binding transcriptional regulator [Geminicoccaceae bacterium]
MDIGSRSRSTAQDVAERAGVSRAAVSRCFNARGRVSGDKRERILAAASELGYRPNAIARSLTGQPTDLVALITTESLGYQSNEQLRAITLCLAERGKRALIIPVGAKTTLDESSLRALDYQVDAIVVMGGSISRHVVELLAAARVPLLLFGRAHEGAGTAAICCDNAEGGAIAARCLTRLGRTRLAYVGKSAGTFADRARLGGFVGELRRQGLEPCDMAADESSFAGGRRAAATLLAAAEPPDGLFCFNDTVAFGALQAARDFRLRVPEDVAIVGFDDQPMAAWPAFDLTTVGCDSGALAELAAAKILAALGRGEQVEGTFLVRPYLVVRGTTP